MLAFRRPGTPSPAQKSALSTVSGFYDDRIAVTADGSD